MNKELLNTDVQTFINNNLAANISSLALTKNPFPEIDFKSLLNQISAKSKAKEKLPTWFNAHGIYYPEKISIEQSSSEKTAQYKADLVSGNSLIDLSGGFGVDDFYFSKRVTKVAHCEFNAELSSTVDHNFRILNVHNVACYKGDSTETLKNFDQQWDWIYVDPARRHDHKGKVFMLKDCVPNVPELLEIYFKYSNRILIKTAPLLDISAGLSELSNVAQIHIVAVNNEVKELLWLIDRNFTGNHNIVAVNLTDQTESYDFDPFQEYVTVYSSPKKYIYEPNASIMKAGAFGSISSNYGVSKLHQHSHLYTSDELIDFPGRRFIVDKALDYNKTEMRILAKTKMNITTRNFPETVEEIRKKWKILDGGKCYSFFTTDADNRKIVLLCSKLLS